MNQSAYTSKFEKVKLKNKLSLAEFRSVRSKYAYVGFLMVPNVLFNVALLAQYTEQRFIDGWKNPLLRLKQLEKIFSEAAQRGLNYVHISRDQMEVVACIDAAFALDLDKSSQLGMLAMILNKANGKVYIVHYTSTKSK